MQAKLLKPIFFPFYSIVALLCRFKALLHTCTVWMDLSLSILLLFSQRYVLSIMTFISHSCSPEGNIELIYPNAGMFDRVKTFTVFIILFSTNDFLRKCFCTATMSSYTFYPIKTTSGITWMFYMCLSYPHDCPPLRNLCKVKQGRHQLHIIVMTKPHSQ